MRFRYIPAIGKRVKLQTFNQYVGYNLHVWAWLEVKAIVGEVVSVEILNGDQPTGKRITVWLDEIAKPIGWAEVYTIHVKPEEVDKVLGWMDRGIAVRYSHDLSNAGSAVFQPLDNSEQPHWQYPELTDAVKPEETAARIRVVQVEHLDPLKAPGDGRWFSQLSRSEKDRARREMAKDGWTVFYKYGFWQATRETVVKEAKGDEHAAE